MVFYCRERPFYNCKKVWNDFDFSDFAIPYDTRVDDKEVEKIEKYLDLDRELKESCNMQVTKVPLVVGVLGTPAKSLGKRLKTIGIETKIAEL